jgi:Lactate racemase N-terminal domain
MSTNGQVALERFRILEKSAPSVPALAGLEREVVEALSGLNLSREKLLGRRIALTVGSRGIASLKEIVKAACGWLNSQGAHPFLIPAMGSHGGSTAEGQQAILTDYGITPESMGVEIKSDMATVRLGETPEGFQVFVDRNAWEADSILVLNRIKPHTDFSGKIESGLLKMICVGMGKRDGAGETHRWARKFGHESVIRAISAFTLSRGKILCGLAVVENELHQIGAVRAALPGEIPAMEEATLPLARSLVPRLPFRKLHLLVVDEMGKNISGAGMDTKVIGRGTKLPPGERIEAGILYVRDLTAASEGNAVGVGMADVIHERLYRKIDLEKVYINAQTSLNPPMARLPMYLPSDRAALDFALGTLGRPDPGTQRIVWIRNTLGLDRIAISASLGQEARGLSGWRLLDGDFALQFDKQDDVGSPLAAGHRT